MPGSPPWTWRPRATSRSPHASSCPRTGPRPGCTPDRPRRGWRAGDPGSAPGRRSCRRETCRWRCPKRHPSSLPSRRFFLRWCSDSWTRGPVPAAGGTRRRGVLLEALELRRDGLDTAGDVTALGLPVALLLAERCDFLEQGAGVLPLELRLRFLEPLLELGALGHEQRAFLLELRVLAAQLDEQRRRALDALRETIEIGGDDSRWVHARSLS